MLSTWNPLASLNKRRAFGILAYLSNNQNETKLFQIGGMNPLTYESEQSVEMYINEDNSWELYRDIPNEDFKFPESPDYGCLAVHENIIYSVGLTEITALDWNRWQVSRVIACQYVNSIILCDFLEFPRLLNGMMA